MVRRGGANLHSGRFVLKLKTDKTRQYFTPPVNGQNFPVNGITNYKDSGGP